MRNYDMRVVVESEIQPIISQLHEKCAKLGIPFVCLIGCSGSKEGDRVSEHNIASVFLNREDGARFHLAAHACRAQLSEEGFETVFGIMRAIEASEIEQGNSTLVETDLGDPVDPDQFQA